MRAFFLAPRSAGRHRIEMKPLISTEYLGIRYVGCMRIGDGKTPGKRQVTGVVECAGV